MSVQPNTTIKIYRRIPLDNTYQHTLYFESVSAQNDYFHGRAPLMYTLDINSYQRVNSGTMRIAKSADDLYECNYLAFRNTNHGNKWFYAFITSIEYVNENTSLITYELDVIQTDFLDCTLKDSFVEREHSVTDVVGENTQPESISLGEFMASEHAVLQDDNDQVVIIMISDTDIADYGAFVDGVYGGCDLFVYNIWDTANIRNKISEYSAKPESIVGIYQCPLKLIRELPMDHHIASGFISVSEKIELPAIDPTKPIAGEYVPRNKKLFTYPFNYLLIDNGKGGSLALRYEFFDGVPTVEINGTVINPVQLVLRPCGYKGLRGKTTITEAEPSTLEALPLDGYPNCSWVTDSFQTYLGQNAVPNLLNVGGNAIATAIGGSLLAAGPAGAIIGGVTGVIGAISQYYTASNQADPCRGNVGGGNVNIAHRKMVYTKQRMHVQEEQAKVIDNFFDMYGYSTNRVKVPNISSRPYWNYVKTIGCNLSGNAPAMELSQIKSIFDKGITFWKDTAAVCDYSRDNSPVDLSERSNDE